MAAPLGPQVNAADAPARDGRCIQAKKKGCKQKKCSHWKGGKCRCGRD
ncbi:MAG: hypothetical protein KGO47_02010 [Cyanobacteria bacterium REEB417]|nr:hypothetical protein [Cyanobacteria bacterium REEB417]